MKKHYHVIIVGAGPSGLSTAINLKKNDIADILVIDKSKFPRYKCCAGYITNKTSNSYKRLGLDIKDCYYSLIDDFNILYKGKKYQNIVNKFLYTNRNIDRVELDYELFKVAKNKKINILENVMIKSIDKENKKLILSNDKQVSFDYMVYADGTSSSGSKENSIKKKNIALQAIFKSDLPDGIDIHFGVTKHGYAWVSRYKGTINVGITDIYNKEIDYHKVIKEFISSLDLSCEDKDIKGAFTPIGVVKPILDDYIYYVGDAVGACDPLTLSGLRYGIDCGYQCAKSIANKDPNIYKKYINKLRMKFKFMEGFQYIFYLSIIQFLLFNVGCRLFKSIISFAFNHLFLNKK